MAGTAATNGFDIVVELNEFALTTGLQAAGALPRMLAGPLPEALGGPGEFLLNLQPPSVFLDMPPGTPGPPGQLTILVPFVGSVLRMSRVAGATGQFTFLLEGSLLFGQPPAARRVPGAPTFKDVALDYSASIGRTEVTLSAQSNSNVADELARNKVPRDRAPDAIKEIRQLLDLGLRAFLAGLGVVPLTPPVSAVPGIGLPFVPTDLDVVVIEDPTPADRDAMLLLIRTCGPSPAAPPPDKTAFTAAAGPPGAPVSVTFANWPVLHCALMPALAAALAPIGVTVASFSPTLPCALAGPIAVALPGLFTFTLTGLTGTINPPTGFVVTATLTNRTPVYAANATIRIGVTLVLGSTPTGPTIMPVLGPPAVSASVDLAPGAYLLGGLASLGFAGPLAAFTNILATAWTDALADVVLTGILNAIGSRVTAPPGPAIPLGPAVAGITINSLVVDDLVIGGEPILSSPARRLEVVDAVGTVINTVEVDAIPPAGTTELFGLFVENRHTEAVTISSISLFDPDGAFTIGHGHGFPVTVPAGARNGLTCAFHPQREGLHTAAVSLFTTDASHPALTVNLTGQAGPPLPRARLEVDRAAIDFGIRLVGSTAQERVTVRNVGEREGRLQASIVSQMPAGQFPPPSVPGGVGVPIPPGQSQPVDLLFVPTSAGSAHATAQLSLASGGSTDSRDVTLVGRGGAPVLVMEPPGVLDFGVLQPGKSAARPLLIYNQGDLDLDLLGLRLLQGLSFRLDPAQSFPVRVPPGGRASITLQTFGAAIGGQLATEFEVLSNDPAGQQAPPRLMVVGTIAGPRIRFTDFLDLGVDTTVPRRGEVVIENIGTTDLTVEAELHQPAPVFSMPNQPRDFIVTPGQSHVVTVDFSADKPRTYGAVLVLHTNVPSRQQIQIGVTATLA